MLIVSEPARVRAAIAPMHVEARVSSPQTSQVVAGHTVMLLEQKGDWWRVRGADKYEGWIHRGYLEKSSGDESSWRLSTGIVVREADGREHALPLNARVADSVTLISGRAVSANDLATQFPSTASALVASAAQFFTGASYQWGGLTPWACDCSGMVQSVFALHGIPLPRDAYQQALIGEPIPVANLRGESLAQLLDGDLLYFSDRDDRRVTHVGISLSGKRMLHSALGRGGVSFEDLNGADDYVLRLRQNFVSARRVI
ncbi:MAG: SH3 domain-containing C40 family peptidase [Gemmatimonadaceae bacterium]